MIFEQALMHLPEVLAGSGYERQEYEGGIVAAFALATLQALNGRHAQNPLSLMQAEKLYQDRNVKKAKRWIGADGKRRYLRADLYLNLYPLAVGNKKLAQYGWRHNNWLEAKFFRKFTPKTQKPAKSTNQTTSTAALLTDLLRLLALCPHGMPKKADSSEIYIGRYLLHVYSNRPSDHVSLTYADGTKRTWLNGITELGQQSVNKMRISDEADGVVKKVGSRLKDLEFQFTAVNTLIQPVIAAPSPFTYTCILSRITSFEVAHMGRRYGHGPDWKPIADGEKPQESHQEIAASVAKYISIKDDAEKNKPTVPIAESDDNDNEHGEDA